MFNTIPFEWNSVKLNIMVRLNRNRLPEDLLNELFRQLNEVLGTFDAKQVDSFLYDLLGPEERIMIAKRLAIVVMVRQGHSLYKISRTLKVSPTTAEKISSEMSAGAFKNIVPLLQKNAKNYRAILKTINSILQLVDSLPRYGLVHNPKRKKK